MKSWSANCDCRYKHEMSKCKTYICFRIEIQATNTIVDVYQCQEYQVEYAQANQGELKGLCPGKPELGQVHVRRRHQPQRYQKKLDTIKQVKKRDLCPLQQRDEHADQNRQQRQTNTQRSPNGNVRQWVLSLLIQTY